VGRDGADAPRWVGIDFDPKSMSFNGSLGPTVSLDCIFAGVSVDPASYSIKVAMIDGTELKIQPTRLVRAVFPRVEGTLTSGCSYWPLQRNGPIGPKLTELLAVAPEAHQHRDLHAWTRLLHRRRNPARLERCL
jgi:hypothetical protein